MGEKRFLRVFVISDATGRTAESVIKAVLLQFPDVVPRLDKFSYVRRKEQIQRILDEARDVGGIVIYSIVSKELTDFIREEGRKHDLILFDLLGPLMGKVRRLFNLIPISTPGLLEHVREESLRLAESIDFTLKHDDGLGMDTIHEADLVILGVSRTSKTPTSIYLACNHLMKVANVPILLGEWVPHQVGHTWLPTVGFTITPERLLEIRRSRMKNLPDYADLAHIHKELEHSEHLFRLFQGIRVIDVTCMSIEEIADKILGHVVDSGRRASGGQ